MTRCGLLVALFLAACSANDPQGGAREVFVVHAEPGVDVTVEAGRLIFPLAGHEDLLERAAGDLLVSDRGTGFLRRVVSVERVGQTVVVVTQAADLSEILIDGAVGKELVAGGKSDEVGGGFAGFHFELEGPRLIHPHIGLDVEIVEAHAQLRPRLDISAEVRRRKLESFRMTATGMLDAGITADVTIDGHLEKTFQEKLWKKTHVAVQFIGEVPVVEVIELSVGAQFVVEADGAARVRIGGRATGPLTAGAVYRRQGGKGDWTPIAEQALTFTPSVEILSGEARVNLEGGLFAQLEVRFYDAIGPVLTVSPYVSVEHALGTPDWTPSVGVSAEISALLKLPLSDDDEWTPFSVQLFDARAVFPPVQIGGDAPEEAGGCGALDYQGECAGNTVRWCEDETIHTLDCAAGCGWRDDEIGYDCL